jgi:hypothetical protein
MVSLQLVVFVAYGVTPAIRAQVAGWSGTSHQIIYFTPDRRLTRRFFGIKLHGSFAEHLLRDGRKHSFGTLPSCCVPGSPSLDIIERHLDSEPLAGTEAPTPDLQLLLQDRPLNVEFVKPFYEIPLRSVRDGYHDIGFVGLE